MSEFMENRNNGIGCQLQLNLMCKPFTLILDNSRLDMTVLPRTLAETMGAFAVKLVDQRHLLADGLGIVGHLQRMFAE